MEWWAWIILGLGLLAGELLIAGTFFLFFFGIAALVVGALIPVLHVSSLLLELAVFIALAVALVFSFREKLVGRVRIGRRPPLDSLAGEVAILQEELTANGVAKAELRGGSWNARSSLGHPFPKGQRCIVDRVEGLTLYLRAELPIGERQ